MSTQDQYDFISYEHFYAVLRPLLAKHKLACIPSITGYDEVIQNQKVSKEYKGTTTVYEKQCIRTRLIGKVLIVCGETGDSIEFGWTSADQDYGGKSMAQAETEFDKRALMKVFKVSSKGDVDPDTKTVELTNEPEGEPEPEKKPAPMAVNTPASVTAEPDNTEKYRVHYLKEIAKTGVMKQIHAVAQDKFKKDPMKLSLPEMKSILEEVKVKFPSKNIEV